MEFGSYEYHLPSSSHLPRDVVCGGLLQTTHSGKYAFDTVLPLTVSRPTKIHSNIFSAIYMRWLHEKYILTWETGLLETSSMVVQI